MPIGASLSRSGCFVDYCCSGSRIGPIGAQPSQPPVPPPIGKYPGGPFPSANVFGGHEDRAMTHRNRIGRSLPFRQRDACGFSDYASKLRLLKIGVTASGVINLAIGHFAITASCQCKFFCIRGVWGTCSNIALIAPDKSSTLIPISEPDLATLAIRLRLTVRDRRVFGAFL